MNALRATTRADLVMMALFAAVLGWTIRDANVRSVARTSEPSTATRAISWPDMRININTANAAELSVLPGLGPALAQRIIEHRQTHGTFGSISELQAVPGIGPSIIERLGSSATMD